MGSQATSRPRARRVGSAAGGRRRAHAEPDALEQQQDALLRILRGAHGAPVSFAEIQQAGIEFPASVACELELAGTSIEHCSLSVEQGTARRARVPALRLDPRAGPGPAQVLAPAASPDRPPRAVTGDPRRRIYVARPKLPFARSGRGALPAATAPALVLLGAAALAAILIATLGGGGKPAASARTAAGAGTHRARPSHAPASRAPASRAQASRAPAVSEPARHARVREPPVAVSAARAAELESQGHSLLEAGSYSQAIPVLREAVAATGESVANCASPASEACLTYAYALYDLGRSLQLGGDPAAAVPILERRLEIDNQRPVVQAALEAARASARR